jgi:hypothetical protein
MSFSLKGISHRHTENPSATDCLRPKQSLDLKPLTGEIYRPRPPNLLLNPFWIGWTPPPPEPPPPIGSGQQARPRMPTRRSLPIRFFTSAPRPSRSRF